MRSRIPDGFFNWFEAKEGSAKSGTAALKREESGKVGKSCAQDAYGWQGVKKDGLGNVTDDSFPGHDNYQNGVIPNGSDSTIYCTNWYDGQPGSGYFTDQATVDSCTHDSVLNSNELGEALQTAPSNYGTGGGDYQHKPNCTAYDVDWNRLNDLQTENPELYGRLTNPDGLSPDNDGIKCAYGCAEANPQYGAGQGNQYYIDKDTFNDAKSAGVLKENPDKSFSEAKGNLSRTDIPNDAAYENKMASEKNNVMAAEEAKQQPDAEQMNSHQVSGDPGRPFIAQPDAAYGYGQINDSQRNGSNAEGQPSKERPEADMTNGPPNQLTGSQQAENGSRQQAGSQTQSSVDRTGSQKPESESREGSISGQGQSGGTEGQNSQSSKTGESGSEGMPTTAANLEGSGAGTEKASSSGMAASNDGSNPSEGKGSSDGMSVTAAGQSGSAPSNTSGQSNSSGQSM